MNDETRAIVQRPVLVPETISDAIRLAELMATSKLVPAALQKSPADCLMVIQQAIRWEMDPFAVAQECSVIQGKLMHSGKLVAAVVNSRGNLTERLSYKFTGEGDNRTIHVSGQLQGEAIPRTVDVVLRNAKTTNAMWTKQPDQQLMYHGVRVWARRHTPELMLGVWSPEEFPETNGIPRRPPQAAPNVMRAVEPPHDSETGEVLDEPESSPSAPQAVGEPQPIAGAMGAAEAPASRSASVGAGATSDVNKLDAWLASEALQGSEALDKAWDRLTTDKRWEALTVKQRQGLEKAFYSRHQVTAANADQDIANDLAARE